MKKNNSNFRKEKEALLLRKKINFMSPSVIKTKDGLEFEDYFSQQMSNIYINNKQTPTPLDFGVDIFVYGDIDYAVQLKHYKSSVVRVSAVQEVYAGADYYGNYIPVVITTGRYTDCAIMLAEKLNVELIDRKDIRQWHNRSYKRTYSHVEDGLYRYVQKYLMCKMELLKIDKR